MNDDDFKKFSSTFVQELMSMSDEDVLGGEDPAAVKGRGLALLKAAKAEAGRRRLAAAKMGAAMARVAVQPPVPSVSIEEARRYLAAAAAANDGRYTLAARLATDMPDAEVLRIYMEVKALEEKARGQ